MGLTFRASIAKFQEMLKTYYALPPCSRTWPYYVVLFYCFIDVYNMFIPYSRGGKFYYLNTTRQQLPFFSNVPWKILYIVNSKNILIFACHFASHGFSISVLCSVLTPVIIVISRRDRCPVVTFCHRRGRDLRRNRHLL